MPTVRMAYEGLLRSAIAAVWLYPIAVKVKFRFCGVPIAFFAIYVIELACCFVLTFDKPVRLSYQWYWDKLAQAITNNGLHTMRSSRRIGSVDGWLNVEFFGD